MARADLHIHTRHSDGLMSVEQLLAYVEHETDLDVIALTDHEDVTAGLRARELASRRGYRFEVVPGVEVTTRHGHLLALFVDRAPPLFRSIEATLAAVHGRGGVAVVPHADSWLTRSVSRRTVNRVQARGEPGILFDGIETANPSPAGRQSARASAALARRWRLPGVGGSDAHHLLHVGTGWTEFAGGGAAGLRDALLSGDVIARMSSYPSLREIGLRSAALGLAWGYAATPRKVVQMGFSFARAKR